MHVFCAVVCDIGRHLPNYIYDNGGTNYAFEYTTETCGHFNNNVVLVVDSQNIDTLFAKLSVILADIY